MPFGVTNFGLMTKFKFALLLAALISTPTWSKDHSLDRAATVLVEEHDVSVSIAERIKEALRSALPGTRLPTPLVLAIMKVESGFNPAAKGGGGAAGLMQVMPNVHLGRIRDLSDKPNLTVNGAQSELMKVDINVEAGVGILADCYAKHNGNADRTAECYNGYNNPKGMAYRAKVLRAYREFSSALGFQPN